MTTDEPSTTESTSLVDIVPESTTLADSTTELFSQTAGSAGPTPDSGVNLIGYVIGGFAGAICIFFVAIIAVVVLRYLVRRMKHNRDTQYCGNINNPSEFNIIFIHNVMQ
jgi:galactitol-specific phosphotransferase system IIC component